MNILWQSPKPGSRVVGLGCRACSFKRYGLSRVERHNNQDITATALVTASAIAMEAAVAPSGSSRHLKPSISSCVA